LSLWLIPAVLVIMNVAYAVAAYPAGVLSDRRDRRTILIVGFAILVAADIALAMANSISGVTLGVALWGLHMGFTQGLLAALVADVSPVELRGTAFGFFNLASGIAALIASLAAGALWDTFGPAATFSAGAGFTIVALVGLLAARHRLA
jgi:MFS family permease